LSEICAISTTYPEGEGKTAPLIHKGFSHAPPSPLSAQMRHLTTVHHASFWPRCADPKPLCVVISPGLFLQRSK
jgi:hypothetical protein